MPSTILSPTATVLPTVRERVFVALEPFATEPSDATREMLPPEVAAVTENDPDDCAAPFGPVTETGPDVAPAGTVAVIVELDTTVKGAAVPLKATDVAPVNPLPEIVTNVPTGPEVGRNDVIVGGAGGGALVPPKAPFRSCP